MAAKTPFLNYLLPKVNQIKYRSSITSISLLVALIKQELIIWESKCHEKPLVLCDGYVKYEKAEVHRSAIMQDFRDDEKNKIERPTGAHFEFCKCKICHGLSL